MTRKTKHTKKIEWWVVGLRGWVEIRSSYQPLKAHTSSATVTGKKFLYLFTPNWGQTAQVKYRLRSTFWFGGRINGRLRSRVFRALTGFSMGPGRARVISADLAKQLLERKST